MNLTQSENCIILENTIDFIRGTGRFSRVWKVNSSKIWNIPPPLPPLCYMFSVLCAPYRSMCLIDLVGRVICIICVVLIFFLFFVVSIQCPRCCRILCVDKKSPLVSAQVQPAPLFYHFIYYTIRMVNLLSSWNPFELLTLEISAGSLFEVKKNITS